jgi:hypothetical protein
VSVEFSPTGSSAYEDEISIRVTPASTEEIRVPLSGRGRAPALALTGGVGWDGVEIGCAVHAAFTIDSTGLLPLEVTQIGIDGDDLEDWSLDHRSLPFTLAPGEREALNLTWQPSRPGSYVAEIVVRGSVGGTPEHRAAVSGNAVEPEPAGESWTVVPRVDFLLLPADDGFQLVNNPEWSVLFGELAEVLSTSGVDFRVAAVTTDGNPIGSPGTGPGAPRLPPGTLTGWRIADSNEPDLQQALVEMLQVAYGSATHDPADVLADIASSGALEGNLLRPGARLVVATWLLTATQTTSTTVLAAGAGLDALVPSDLWRLHASLPLFATTFDGSPLPGIVELSEFSAARGGVVEEVEDLVWTPWVADFVGPSARPTSFVPLSLERRVASASIEGVAVLNWTQAESDRLLDLGFEPVSGTVVQIEYEPVAECPPE